MTISKADFQVFSNRSSRISVTFFRIFIAFILISSIFLDPRASSVQARPDDAPTADIAVTLPAEGLVGEPVNFNVTLSNLGTIGYGPFIDLIFPLTGADGDDGLDFDDATYLGAPLTKVINVFPAAVFPATEGCLAHPYAKDSTGLPVEVCGKPGDKLVTILMPFGSFVPGQPDVTVNISATMSKLADVGTALTVQTRGGYMYGNDEYDNPQTDSSMVGGFTSSSITPTLMTLTKTYVGPEDETATGPNYPRKYLITANIADGQTLTDFDLTDILPDNLQYVQVDSTTPSSSPILTPPTDAPGGTLTRRFASVTGTTAANDAEMLYTYFVPLKNSTLSNVIPPATGAFQPSSDDAKASGTWNPIDVRDRTDPLPVVTSDLTLIDHTLWDKSIAIQKSVSATDDIKPQTILTYTLNIQISDFFAFDEVIATDTFSDGQRWFTNGTYKPTLAVNGNKFSIAATEFSAANFSVDESKIGDTTLDADPTNLTDGSTTVTFNLSEELKATQPNGWMVGGCVPVADDLSSGGTGVGVEPLCSPTNNDGPTTATITFYTQIQDEFSDNFDATTNDKYVNQGDSVGNDVTVSGKLLNTDDLSPTGVPVSDGSSAGVSIERGSLEKSVYAKNGVICSPTCGMLRVGPGDTVTYRIKYLLPTSDLEAFKIDDFLPLPIFRATEMNTFVETVSADAPPAGSVKFGPDDTFYSYSGIEPGVSNNSTENSFTIFYGDHYNAAHTPTVVDLLFTVTVRPDTFADELFLTNQAHSHEGNTAANIATNNAIVQIQVTEPLLNMRKGIVYTDHDPSTEITFTPSTYLPSGVTFSGSGCARFDSTIKSSTLAATLKSDVSGLDAGDRVTYAIVVENKGSGLNGAFDVTVKDTLPANMTFVPGSICVTNGARDPIGYTGDLTTGLKLDDPSTGTVGALARFADDGKNIAVITYDATLNTSLPPRSKLTNQALLINYASAEGGPNFLAEFPVDSADVNTIDASLSKELVSSSIENTANARNQVVIGELVNYKVNFTVPEGTLSNVQITDVLPAGMAFTDKSITINSLDGVNINLTGFSRDASTIKFNFSSIENSNNDAADEVITIEYQVVVTNVNANNAGDTRRNSATLTYDGGSKTAQAPNVTILEPRIDVQKLVAVVGSNAGGSPVTYTIILRNPDDTYATDAFDLVLEDKLPTLPGGASAIDIAVPATAFTVSDPFGPVDSSYFELVGSNAAGWTFQTKPGVSIDMPLIATREITITIAGTISYSAGLGQTISNTATGKWSSLDGTPGDLSTYTTDDTERDGSGGFNDYSDPGTADIIIQSPGVTKEIILPIDQAFTNGTDVAIGEKVRYRITYVVPRGTAYDFTSVDTLDNGLAVVQCDSVTNPDGRLTATNGFDCTNAVMGTNGATMTISFGTLTNSSLPTDTETIVIEYTAVVTNTNFASRGAKLNNSVDIKWKATPLGADLKVSGVSPEVTVVEPTLLVTKTVNPGGRQDAGNEMTYTINISHTAASNTNAYNVVWEDTIPAGMTFVPLSLGYSTSGTNVMPDSISSADPAKLTASWDMLAKGSTAQITFKVRINNDVTPNQTITNSAPTTYTSLPGTVAGPLSLFNPNSCERTGINQPCGLGENDYSLNPSVPVQVGSPSIAKTLFTTSSTETSGNNLTIGEIATFDLTVTLPEGVTPATTPSLRVTDVLPAGMQYVPGSTQLVLGTFNGTVPAPTVSTILSSPATLPVGNGDDIRFDFTQITTTADDVTTNNSFVIRFQALVLDVPSNIGFIPTLPAVRTTLSNTANVRTGTSGTLYTSNAVSTPIVEPRLAIVKSVNPTKAANNDTVTFSFTATNSGLSTAFDVVIEDPISETVFSDIASTCNVPTGFKCSTSSTAGITTVRFDSDGTATGGQIAVGAGNAKTFSFTAKVKTLATGATYNNIVTVKNETTLPGTVTGEREEPDVSSNVILTGIAPDLTLDKDNGKTFVIPGELITYNLLIKNVGERTATGITIAETVPPYTTFDPAINPGWSCSGTAAGSTCTYAEIPGLTLAFNATKTVPFKVTVLPVVPAGSLEIGNLATVTEDGTHGIDPNITNNTNDDIDPITAGPTINPVKSVKLLTDVNSDGLANPGDTLEYTVVVTNSGNQDAISVVFKDTPDANTKLVVGSVTPTGDVVHGNTAGDTNVEINIGTLAGGGGSYTVKFNVTINDPLAAGVTNVYNKAAITGGNITPKDSNEVVTPVVAAPDLTISKVDDVTEVIPGDAAHNAIIYTISYANVGDQNATGVKIVEDLPANTSFDAANSTGGTWTCAGTPVKCTLPIGDLAGRTGSGTVKFAVKVNATVPAGVILIHNIVTISDDGANGTDPTPLNNTDDEDTPLTAVPDIAVTKDDGNTQTTPGSTVDYTITVKNNGNQGATNVLVTEEVPANSIFVSGPTAWTGCAAGAAAGTTCTYTIASLPAGNSTTLHFLVEVDNPIPAGVTQLINNVTAYDDGTNGVDPTADNEDDDTDDIVAAPNMGIDKDDGQTTVSTGQTLTYTLTVTNTGNEDAVNSLVTETVPANTKFVAGSTAWSCGDGDPAGTICTYNFATFAAGDTQTLEFKVIIDAAVPSTVSTIINNAKVENSEDVDSSNDNTSDTDDLNASPDLSVEKTDNLTDTTPGATLTYVITVKNNGDKEATGVVVTETVPANTLFKTLGSDTWAGCANNAAPGTVCTISLASLPAGDSQSFNFVVLIDNPIAAGVEKINNTVSVTNNNGDPDLTDNEDTDVDNLAALPDLTIVKTDDVTELIPGDSAKNVVTYTLVYTNVGDQAATGVVITETIPVNTTFVDGPDTWDGCSTGSGSGTTCTYTVGTLAGGGATGSVTFKLRVTDTVPAGVTKITNTAIIADDGTNGADPTPDDNTDDEDTPVTAIPDIAATKDDGLTTTTPGSTLDYTIVVTNQGNMEATGVTVTDKVPANTTFVDGPDTWDGCITGSGSGTTCTVTIPSLLAGNSVTLHFLVKINDPVAALVTQIKNTVTAYDDNTHGDDPTPGNNISEDVDDLTAAPEMSIVKDDGQTTVTTGQTLTYTLTVKNTGNEDAVDALVTETVPNNTKFKADGSSSWSCADGAGAGSSCTYNFATFAAGTTQTLTFKVTIDSTVPATVSTILNNAKVENAEDVDPSNNNTSDEDNLNASPDLSVEKTDNRDDTAPGETLTYVIIVTNNGDKEATNVVVTETVPANTVFKSSGTDTWINCPADTAAGTVCTISFASLPAGGSRQFAFTVQVDNPVAEGVETIVNTVSVANDNGDPDLTDNEDTDTDILNAFPDLTIVKTDDVAKLIPGDSANNVVTYTLVYTNVGNQAATGVVITETIPANTTTDGVDNSLWTCTGTAAGDTCTYPIGTLAGNGGSGSVTFKVRINDTVPAGVIKITNIASIADDGTNGADPTPTNNTDDEDTPVEAAPDIKVVKTDSKPSTAPGSENTYAITVSNEGNKTATGITVTEIVPANTTFVAAGSDAWTGCSDGAAAGTTCTITFSPLEPGETRDFTFVIRVNNPVPALVVQIKNTVTAYDDGTNGADPTPENNISEDIDDLVAAPDLKIVKTDHVDQVAPGTRLVYELTVNNLGNKEATGIVVTDLIPVHTTYFASAPAGTYNPVTREVTWTLASMKPTDPPVIFSVTVDVDKDLDPTKVSTIVNTANVKDDGKNGEDPTPANNETEDTDLVGQANKRFIGSESGSTKGNDIAIGELVNYEVTLIVRPGELKNLKLVDTLGQGLALVKCQVEATANLDATPVAWADICNPAAPTGLTVEAEPAGSKDPINFGRKMNLNFGTVVNSGLTDGTITIRYQAVVLNNEGNVSGKILPNSANWTWDGGKIQLPVVNLQLVEPKLIITKDVKPKVVMPGTTVTYTITIAHDPKSTSDAFDVTMVDLVPRGVKYIENTLAFVSGQQPQSLEFQLPDKLTAKWDVFTRTGPTTVLQFQARVGNITPGRSIKNTASVEWSSLKGDFIATRSPYNPLGTERYFDPASNINNYGAESTAKITSAEELPATGFAPNRVTDLPEQPANKVYQQAGDLTLEIPAIQVNIPIVGVPLVEGKWDLTWLTDQAGYLEGTAYPTWEGNTGLTGHIYNANGGAGPFLKLDQLKWGDAVIVHANGKKYTYEVRETKNYNPTDLSPLQHEEKAWITLLTCEDYDASSNQFLSRLAVRAVLMKVENE